MNTFSQTSPFLELENISLQIGNRAAFQDFTWTIMQGQNWVVIGPVGSGKSLLAEVILGNYFVSTGKIHYHFIPPTKSGYRDISEFISYVSFSESSNRFSYSKHYYQQRFNSSESEDGITVADYLDKAKLSPRISDLFGLDELFDRHFIKLSNGQTRKVRIAKALSKNRKLLILDDPFIGLDSNARDYLEKIINTLAKTGTQIILLTNRTFIPECITHVLELDSFTIKDNLTKEAYQSKLSREVPDRLKKDIHKLLSNITSETPDFTIAAKFTNVNVTYGEKRILKNLNWTIKKGEKWALLGHNGAGKSTLLSLITADNPQAYSQEITLFDRQRGTGESIWDIKKRIGFVSPELHLYFRSDMNCFNVAGTGFIDTLFLNRNLSGVEKELLEMLFDYFDIPHLKDQTFLRISTGQQRLILFIRAVVKKPVLFILDEPFQGMDSKAVEKCQQLLELYCSESRTVIFVTHIKEEIPHFIDKVYLLEEGEGSTKES